MPENPDSKLVFRSAFIAIILVNPLFTYAELRCAADILFAFNFDKDRSELSIRRNCEMYKKRMNPLVMLSN